MTQAVSRILHVSTVSLLLATCASTASGQWSSGEYEIFRLGLQQPEHTGASGFRYSQISSMNGSGQIVGTTRRIFPGSNTSANGESTWVWDPSDGNTIQTGLIDSAHTGVFGVQRSVNQRQTVSGFVAGHSSRYVGGSTGQSAWVFDPRLASTLEVGLVDAGHTGTSGYRLSTVLNTTSREHVIGTTERISGVNTSNGTSVWVWSPASGTTQRIGLFGAAHTGTGGRQVASGIGASHAGFVYGRSQRFAGAQGTGFDTWIWNPTNETVVMTGLTGAEYTSSTGTRNSVNSIAGRVDGMFGVTNRYTVSGTNNGSDAWAWSAARGETVLVGLTDGEHSSTAGFRSSSVQFALDNGDGVGTTSRRMPDGTANGVSTWVWNSRTQETVKTGIVNDQTTSPTGYHESANDFASLESGHVSGKTRLQVTPVIVNTLSWVWDPVQSTTVRTGLFSAEFTSNRNEQVSRNIAMNARGLVGGTSTRYAGMSSLGESTWAWSPQRGTERIGLYHGPYISTGGIAQSALQRVLDNGLIVGQSYRYVGGQAGGFGVWVWDQSTGLTSEIGVTMAFPNGSAIAETLNIDNSGFVSGRTSRPNESGGTGGYVSWTWNPLTRSTVRTGLDGPEYYGANNFYESRSSIYGSTGAVAGITLRYPTNGSQSLGLDAWYFDPATNLVYQPTEGVPNTVRSDGQANSVPVILTDDGFLLGSYLVFLDSGIVTNAFIFRPDMGFTDLGLIVDGGLSAQGWLSIRSPSFGTTANVLAGIGTLFDQNLDDGSQSVYALRRVPAAGTGVLTILGCGVFASGRRRSTKPR